MYSWSHYCEFCIFIFISHSLSVSVTVVQWTVKVEGLFYWLVSCNSIFDVCVSRITHTHTHTHTCACTCMALQPLSDTLVIETSNYKGYVFNMCTELDQFYFDKQVPLVDILLSWYAYIALTLCLSLSISVLLFSFDDEWVMELRNVNLFSHCVAFWSCLMCVCVCVCVCVLVKERESVER